MNLKILYYKTVLKRSAIAVPNETIVLELESIIRFEEGTHPRFISKYEFIRMHKTGRKGTKGQMKPAEELGKSKCK